MRADLLSLLAGRRAGAGGRRRTGSGRRRRTGSDKRGSTCEHDGIFLHESLRRQHAVLFALVVADLHRVKLAHRLFEGEPLLFGVRVVAMFSQGNGFAREHVVLMHEIAPLAAQNDAVLPRAATSNRVASRRGGGLCGIGTWVRDVGSDFMCDNQHLVAEVSVVVDEDPADIVLIAVVVADCGVSGEYRLAIFAFNSG